MMVTGMKRMIVVALATLLGMAMPGAAFAQVLFTEPGGQTRAYDPLSYYLDGPPDVPGCLKACASDFSPCDSFFMKQTDGRCKRSRGR